MARTPAPPLASSKRPREDDDDAVHPILTDRPVKRLREGRDVLEPIVVGQPLERSDGVQHIIEAPVEDRSIQLPREVEDNPIEHWAREGSWPRRYFEQGPTMEHFLARKKSSSSIGRKRSGSGSSGSVTPSDQRPREEKSAPYRDQRYVIILETKGSFMDEFELGITEASKKLCRSLLENPQDIPRDSLFRDDLFATTCRQVANRNEARVMRDITPLIVPSAEGLYNHGASTLGCLIESINEGWNNSIPLTAPRPQPDFAVGFRRQAFTGDQLDKLSPFIGDFTGGDQSLFMATYMMYFPFLTCEVKKSGEGLEIADRQNAHSMTLAVRAVVDLFRLTKRESEVDRRILAFSVSHNHSIVRICAHYPVITGKHTKYYRHIVRTFDFTEADGKDRWMAYCFTKNLYEMWMPTHFKMICSAIDQLPSHLDFSVSSVPETGFSQDLQGRQLSVLSDADPAESDDTPDTSFTGKRLKRA